ncbi:MAG: tetratricopeptide repeat protein, partial [Planctomycetes bacterium]|nr:tetratricopeptide repeat protein [Planctomycetota bacterium]
MPTPDRPDLLQQTLSGVINLNDSAAAALRAGGAAAMLALLRQTLKDDRDGMKALERMGDTFLRVGAPDDAAECYREGLAMAGRTGDQERTCRFHLALGSALDEAGRAPAALDIYRGGKSIAESLGLRGLEARFLNNLGILTQKGNEPLKAIPYYQKSLELKEAEKDLKGAISTRLNLASLLAAHGRWADLAPQIEKILAAAKEAKDERAEAYGQLLKGQSFGAAGDWQFAIGPLSIALGLFQRVADGEGELTATMSMAESAIELRDGGHAYVLLKSAQGMAERRKDGPRTARILTLFNRLDHLFAAPGQEHTTTPIEEVTRERNGLLRLQEIAKALNQEHDLQRLLERILDSAISLTNAERGILLLKEGEEMRVRVARNYTGVAAAEGEAAAAGGTGAGAAAPPAAGGAPRPTAA